jgi:hypothetical protein
MVYFDDPRHTEFRLGLDVGCLIDGPPRRIQAPGGTLVGDRWRVLAAAAVGFDLEPAIGE